MLLEDTVLVWGRASKLSHLKKFRALVVPSGRCRYGTIIQVIMISTGVLQNGPSRLRRKRGSNGAYVHEPRQKNITYGQTVRQYIYETKHTEQPHLQTHWYKKFPPGTRFTAQLHTINLTKS